MHVIAIPPLTRGERTGAWVAHLPAGAHEYAAAVAARFPLSREQIADACVLAAAHAREERLAIPARRHLVAAGQAVAGTAMGGLARRLEAGWDWDDLVLPADDVATLRSIAAYLRHRETVLDGWGFGGLGGGDGLTVMFCGQSGTGKTMAAQVIANDLGLEAFHVDVSAIVSKYIGETEKNLERLFAAATDAGALMVFDEADALFGKRSAVSDARDRYANLEVSYLLQRIESHPGASILTTNMRQNVDQAFLRRMDFIVDFPLPGEAERLAIWRRHLPPAPPSPGTSTSTRSRASTSFPAARSATACGRRRSRRRTTGARSRWRTCGPPSGWSCASSGASASRQPGSRPLGQSARPLG